MTAGSVSASRQKNCNGCVLTKRRCDRQTPVCSRCLEKKLRCSYGKIKGHSLSNSSGIEPTPPATAPSYGDPARTVFDSDLSLEPDYLGTLPMDSQSHLVAEFTPHSIMDGPGSNDILMGTFMGLTDNNGSPTRDQWLIDPNEAHLIERPNTPADGEIAKGYQEMATFCHQLQPWNLYDPKTSMHYVANRVKGFATDMANHNSTPFLHRYLYQTYTPQPIMSCFSTSVLYANRTPANTAMVMRSIHGSMRDLASVETARVIVTPIEKLARAQALFLYQVICLFDGDVALRASAEKDTPLLKLWLSELCKIRENLGNLAQLEDGVARRQPPEDWERWIFAESVRRTIVMAHSVLSFYELLKDPEYKDEDATWAYTHRWTLSRALWEADSSFEFEQAWKGKPPFIIANYSLSKFLDHGRSEDVDDFAEILLSVYMGRDATRGFMSKRKSRMESSD